MKTSKIEWTEATWNPSIGCTKVSEGCQNCYAEVMAKRLQAMGVDDYKDGFKFKILPHRLELPFKTKKPTKFFVNSMSDLWHEEMPEEFLDQIFEVIKKTPQHTYQLLTKRAENMEKYFKNKVIPKNVWLGVTVECKRTRPRIDCLRNIDAKIKFLSLEPLLEDLGELNLKNIDWAIVGGESGAKARPMKEEWVLNIKEQCKKQETAFFFKQWGTWGADGVRRSKKANGRTLLNKIWDEYPEKISIPPKSRELKIKQEQLI